MEVKGLDGCPFCGSKVEVWDTNFGVVKVLECKNCETRFIFPWYKDIRDWNKRADSGKKGMEHGKEIQENQV